MNATPHNRVLAVSQKIYTRLLVAYPRAHRETYGAVMAQLFCDQSRDAWKESGNWGLAKLWLRVLPDLARTSLLERLLNLNPHKTMADKINGLFRGPSPTSTFFTVATVVFLLTLGASIITTLLLPNTYASITRIKVEPDTNLADKDNSGWTSSDPYFIQTTFEIMRSEMLLSNVIASLNLNEKWGKKFYDGTTLPTEQTIEMLNRRIVLTPVSNTMLINITAYSDDPKEAAQIANALADAYRDYRLQNRAQLTARLMKVMQDRYAQEEEQVGQAQAKVNSMRVQLKVGSQIPDNPTLQEQAYWDAKQDLEQRLAMRKLLYLKLDAAIADSQIPNALENQYQQEEKQIGQIRAKVSSMRQQLKIGSQISDSPTVPELVYWDTKQELDQMQEIHRLLYLKMNNDKLSLSALIPQDILVQIVDLAEPGRAPVKPNRPVNIVIGAVGGGALGLIAGTIAMMISFQLRKGNRRNPIPA